MPTVSVLLPVFNAERYVAGSLESVLCQTFIDFELIIVDDGSTDESLRILREYAARDARIFLTTRENRGLVKTLNEMAGRARGEFIARMDADDISLPERLERQVAFLRRHPEVVCVGGAFELIDEKGRRLTRLAVPESDPEIQKLALEGHTSISHPCAMIRRTALREVGGYDEAMVAAEDLDLWLRLGELGKLANLKDVVLKYRLNTSSISGRNREHQRQQAERACRRAWERRGIHGVFTAAEHWRPGPDRASRHAFMLQYGWWAFNGGHRRTALTYGLRAISARPFQVDGWKLLCCAAIRKCPPDGAVPGQG